MLATIPLHMCLEPFPLDHFSTVQFFLKKGGTISCVVTGPRQPAWYSRDLEKLLRDQQREQQRIC